MSRPLLRNVLLGLAGAFLLAQAVPYGRDHTNPPIEAEPPWDSPRTRDLARRACFDCHSHETVWPWYSHIAPLSWRLWHHVEEGREHFNVSAWNRPQRHAKDAAHETEEGEMPLWDYLLLHPEARLTPEETADLVRGLDATFGVPDRDAH